MVRMNLMLTDEHKRLLDELSDTAEQSMSDTVRRSLDLYAEVQTRTKAGQQFGYKDPVTGQFVEILLV